MGNWKIPFFDSDIGIDEIREVTKVLESRWLTMGEITKRFERQFCEFLNCKHAFAVNNGTAALHLANIAAGVSFGDEVIVPAMTFVASVNSILYTGATPVFADITSEEDFNISPEDIEKKISEKTKAVMVVHYAGNPCNMEKIMQIAKKYNISIIEDVAHAPGAAIAEKKCGTFGKCGCFSFFSNKNMATGEGGMVVTNDDHIAEKLRLIRSHGMTTLTLDRFKGHAFSYDVVDLGYNYRTSEIASAIGIVQLNKLKAKNEKRARIVNFYNSLLKEIDEVKVPFLNHFGTASYHIYPILLDRKVNRQDLMTYLKENGIQTSIHYPPVHQFSFHRTLHKNSVKLEKTEDIWSRELTLPLYPAMTESQVRTVVNNIKSFLFKKSK